MYDLGIVGGMGPEATCDFFCRIVNYTKAKCDQGHIDVCILNKASIPDRTKCIMGGGESPLTYLNKCIDELVGCGTGVFVIPCNTAHFFADDLHVSSKIIFVNMVSETMNYAEQYYPNRRICILGTWGTKKGKIYEKYNGNNKNTIVYPETNEQIAIMDAIEAIKSGINRKETASRIISIISKITNYIEDCIFLLACTELSICSAEISKKYTIIDAMDVLAVRAIEACGYSVDYDKTRVKLR